MNYNETISNVRTKARDMLRLELISARREKIADLNKEVETHNEYKKNLEFKLKCVTYDKSKVDPENPRAEKLLKGYEEDEKYVNDEIKSVDECLVEINKKIEEHNDGIKKIESGETKVSLDRLNELSAILIAELGIVGPSDVVSN